MRQISFAACTSLAQPVVGTVRSTDDEPDVTYVGTVSHVRLSLTRKQLKPTR